MNDTRVLCFQLGEEVFALEIRDVREILQPVPLSPVPLMPDFVRGVMNLRGAVVPVIDLQARLGRAPGRIGKKTCIVVYDASQGGERAEIGLMVDSVSEVVDLPAADQEDPPTFGAPVAREYVRSMARIHGRFVPVLEPERALDIEAMAALCETAQEITA